MSLAPIHSLSAAQLHTLAELIQQWGKALGLAEIGISDIELQQEEPKLQAWLDAGFHGEMHYMPERGMMRARPAQLHPGTQRVICARLDYLPPKSNFAYNLKDPQLGYISRYAGGRDYHKILRKRMKQLGDQINLHLQELGVEPCDCRPFVDSAPILERPLAEKAGLGWVGKHSLLLNQQAGSWFFLAELVINLPLPMNQATEQDTKQGCGSCVACLTTCPTQAIVAPYIVDARRCISYLTIELEGAIPEDLRPLLGNRIYGCDDCQLCCPVNRQAPLTQEIDFHIRQPLQLPKLLDLFAWDETTFLKQTEGSPIRRIGYQRWIRNIAVALGNAPLSTEIIQALTQAQQNELILDNAQQHIAWALAQQAQKKQGATEQPSRQQQRLIRIIEKGLPRDA